MQHGQGNDGSESGLSNGTANCVRYGGMLDEPQHRLRVILAEARCGSVRVELGVQGSELRRQPPMPSKLHDLRG